LPVSGDLRVGGRHALEGNASGTIERCDPPSSFFATWEFGGEVTWIEVRVTAEPRGTHMQIEHISHVDDSRWAEFGPGAVGFGWDLTLPGMSLYLTTRSPVDRAAIAAWLASSDARELITRSSEAWCDAAIEAGSAEADARAAADRTTAAYVGDA
jgi:hypothetical protein